MPSFQYRCLVLIAVLASGTWILAAIQGARPATAPRWPAEDALFRVDGWAASAATTETAHEVQFITRNYYRAKGGVASLVIATGPEAKRIQRTGAEVPFLGSGYTVDPAPPSLVPAAPGRAALLVRRENDVGLLLYAYGERRGLLGTGLLAWGMVALDATLGHANNYYLLRVVAPLETVDARTAAEIVVLADTLFPRLAAWYAD